MYKIIFLLAVWCIVSSCGKPHAKDSVDVRIDSLINLMTLEEKVGQLSLYTSDWDVTGPTMREGYKDDIRKGRVGAIFNAYTARFTRSLQDIAVKESRLHIPLLFGYDVVHGHRTIFPIPLGAAASWDMEAIEMSERIAAAEASAEGLHWTFAPMVDIARDPRWGRMAEGGGEDPYLGSCIAIARVRGFQGDSIGGLNSLMACVKHFAAYGAAQAGRDYNTTDMSERVFREVYLPPYAAGVNAGAATVMSSFNEFDGVPATASKYLLGKILRDDLKFEGFVVSDYTSVMELIPHGIAGDTASAALLSIDAGLDMDMQSGFYQHSLPQLVRQKKLKEKQIDNSVRRILKKKFELGLFDDPYRFSDESREKNKVMQVEFLSAARSLARKSMVLLKNDQHLLPLSKDMRRLAVIGPLADNQREMLGSWTAAGDWKKSVTVLAGIRAAVSPKTEVVFAKGCNINDDSTTWFNEAIRAAQQADAVIMVVGESASMSGEAASRAFLDLPGVQQKLVEEIHRVGKPVVVVLMNGRPLTITWIDKNIPSVLEAWFPGTEAGHAVADIIFGDYNPSGKLPVTFPRSVGQIPIYYGSKNTGRPMDPNNKYTSKYLDESNEPLYPFGFGLSYTTFSYSDVVVDKASVAVEGEVNVSCTVTNTGSVPGEEVVQLYVRDVVGSVTRPVKELKGFKKIRLEPGESKKIDFTLTGNDLSFYRADMTFGPEPGKFIVFVGGNSRDLKSAEFSLR